MNEQNDDMLVRPRRLPSEEYERFRQVLALPAAVATPIRRFAHLVAFAWNHSVSHSPLNGVLVFEGPPGSGKTLAAKVLAQALALHHQAKHGDDVFLFAVHMPALLSEYLGQSGKAVAQMFEGIAFSAQRRPTIVIADEVEALAFSRERVSASDPSDVIRVADELLRQLDALRGQPNFLMIATTNLPGLLDRALTDRADLLVRFEHPDLESGTKILLLAAQQARRLGIIAAAEDIGIAAQTLCNHDGNDRPSGRLLSKLVLLAYVEAGTPKPTADDLIATARKRVAAGEA